MHYIGRHLTCLSAAMLVWSAPAPRCMQVLLNRTGEPVSTITGMGFSGSLRSALHVSMPPQNLHDSLPSLFLRLASWLCCQAVKA